MSGMRRKGGSRIMTELTCKLSAEQMEDLKIELLSNSPKAVLKILIAGFLDTGDNNINLENRVLLSHAELLIEKHLN